MRYFYLLLVSIVISLSAEAQFSFNYEFEEKPDFSKYTKSYDLTTINELEVLDERVIEFMYDKKDQLVEFFYVHNIQYVNSEDALDKNNKIFVNFANAIELVSIGARVILKDGTIKDLSRDALKEGKNENNTKVYFFAISGAEKGCFIEYYYVIKRNPKLNGSYYTFQGSVPVAKVIFKVISPQNLVIKSKTQGNFPEMQEDTTIENKNALVANMDSIPALKSEDQSNLNRHIYRIFIKLFLNKAVGKRNPFNYGLVSQNIYELYFSTLDKGLQKEIDKLYKSIKITEAMTADEQIRTIENYVKKNFLVAENESEEKLSNLKDVLNSKVANESGIMKVYIQLFMKADIPLELVLTSNRYKCPFDSEYENYIFLTDFLIYFPKINKYIVPDDITVRMGIISPIYIDNYGLFIRKVEAGGIATGAGKIKQIIAPAAEESKQIIDVKVKFQAGNDSIEANLIKTYTGNYAEPFQPVFDFIAKENLKKFEDEIVKQINENITIKTINIENKGAASLGQKPFIVKSNFTSAFFIEKAGPRIIFKIGELIGPQSEWYQDKPRQLPVETEFNRFYEREIVVEIPVGYKVRNLEELNMNVTPFAESGDRAGFTSSYQLEGNVIKVICKEYYRVIHFPLDDFEKYRSVINAAATFNKIRIILEK